MVRFKNFFEKLLQEAPVSWKTIQKSFANSKEIGGPEGLDNISKLAGFNSFKEFYDDVYKTLYRDEGGQKYEPSATELIKIFKFLLKIPEQYRDWVKNQLYVYGGHRYRNDTKVFDSLIKLQTLNDFEHFLRSLKQLSGDKTLLDNDSNKVYSDSNIDIYEINAFKEIKPFCKGTTWCVNELYYYNLYTKEKNTKFYIVVSKKEWYNQKEGIRKKYSLRVPKLIDNNIIFNKKFIIEELLKNNDQFFNLNVIINNTLPDIKGEILSILSSIKSSKIHNNFENKQKIENYFTVFEKYINLIKSNKLREYIRSHVKITSTIVNYLKERSKSKAIVVFKRIKPMLQNEFTNNNQNISIKNFDILPEPYHSMLQNFPPYQKIVQNSSKNNFINNYQETIESLLLSEDDLKDIVAEIIEMKILEKNEKSLIFKDYMIKEVDKNDSDALLVYDYFFGNIINQNEYYLIKKAGVDELYSFVTFNDFEYKEFTDRVNKDFLNRFKPILNTVLKIVKASGNKLVTDKIKGEFPEEIKSKIRFLFDLIDREVFYDESPQNNAKQRIAFFVSLYNFLRNRPNYNKDHVSFFKNELKKLGKLEYKDAILLARNIVINAMTFRVSNYLDSSKHVSRISRILSNTKISTSTNGNPEPNYTDLKSSLYSNKINDRVSIDDTPYDVTSGWWSLSKKNFNPNNTVLEDLSGLNFVKKHKSILNIVKKLGTLHIFLTSYIPIFYDDNQDFISNDLNMISNEAVKRFLAYGQNKSNQNIIIGLDNALPAYDIIKKMANKIIEISKK